MKTKIKIIFASMFCFTILQVSAQQDALVSKHLFNGGFYNPAFFGSHDYSTAGMMFRQQWVNFPGAPKTAVLFGDVPFTKDNMGLGGNFTYDKIGVTTRMDLNFNYAYHLKIDEKSKLAFGARVSASHYRSTLTDLQVWNETDPEFTQNVNGMILPNFGFGAYYYSDRFFGGLAVPAVLNYDPNTNFSVKDDKYPDLIRHYYASGGAVIPLSEDFDLKPSAIVRYVKNAPVQADLTLQTLIKKMVFIGVSYRTAYGLVFSAEVQKLGKFRFGYAYDFPLTMMRTYSSGTHELMLAVDFIKDKTERKPRFF